MMGAPVLRARCVTLQVFGMLAGLALGGRRWLERRNGGVHRLG